MKTTICVQDLDGLLDQLPATTQVLSLDCFDTLLWRKLVQPTDVFFSLQNTALFQARGYTAGMRIHSEDMARKKSKLLADTYEVSLTDIYRELMPDADEAPLAQAVVAEVACEIDARLEEHLSLPHTLCSEHPCVQFKPPPSDAAGSGVGRAVARLPVIAHTNANVPHLLAQPEIEGVVARNSSGLIEAKDCGRWNENLAPFLYDFHRERPQRLAGQALPSRKHRPGSSLVSGVPCFRRKTQRPTTQRRSGTCRHPTACAVP